MPEMHYGLVDGQQLAVVRAVLLMGRVELLEKARVCQPFLTRCCSMAPMVDMEVSVASASGADGSGRAGRVSCDRLALQSSKTLRISSVQVMGWEPLTLRPERTPYSGVCVAAVWGRNRLYNFSIPRKRCS
jgi:hypothetical protein